MINFDDCELSLRSYGGAAGRKEGIIYYGEPWMIKYPDNLKEKDLKNVDESYGNNPVVEYIGSQVYDLIGIPVHETLLGTRNGKVVVACKDFIPKGNRLVEFRELKVTYVPHFMSKEGDITNGTGMDLNEALQCIRGHHILSKISGVEERFWQMFVVDALNGNPDRNNGNWGCILDEFEGTHTLAPVYDNGNCLYFRFSIDKMEKALLDKDRMQQLAVTNTLSRFSVEEHKINPFSYIRNNIDNIYIRKAVELVLEKVTLPEISTILHSTNIDDILVTFYAELYTLRLKELKDIMYSKGYIPIESIRRIIKSIPEAVRNNYPDDELQAAVQYYTEHKDWF